MDIRELNEAISKALNENIKPIKAIEPTEEEQAFLDDMARKIENEDGISYAELSNLQSLQPQVVWLGDIRLAEWSGIPEEVWNISCIDESLKPSKTGKKAMKESHIFTKDELANNRFVKLYQKCYEYRKEHPEMEAYEIANKLCFNENEGWVITDEIAQTWADMFVYDGAKDEDLIQKIREDIVEMIEEYLLDDEQDGDFE